MKIGELIDQLYERRASRLELDRQVKELKSQETALREEINHMLKDMGLQKASGETATASIRTKISPIVSDWEAVYDFVVVNNRFDLLHKRLTEQAWKDLLSEGILVPGTESYSEDDLSLTKSTR